MQGRLSPKVGEFIQAFPKEHWQEEFKLAHQHQFEAMEWTLDQEGLFENPFMHRHGQREIIELKEKYHLKIPSVTCDCFMQAPFFKAEGKQRDEYYDCTLKVIEASLELGLSYVVLPIVDNSKIENSSQNEVLLEGFQKLIPRIQGTQLKIVMESDMTPKDLKSWISDLDPRYFGVNFDMGNSAGMGFDPVEEIGLLGKRILNVHVKDRVLGGTTVPLGMGNAKFPIVFQELRNCHYQGNFVLQTARAETGKDVPVLCHYRDLVQGWLKWN